MLLSAKSVAAALALYSTCASAGLIPKLLPGFVSTNGQKFQLNGRPYYFAGTNAYWFQFISDINDVSLAMDKAKAAGLEVIRTWGFNEVNVTTIPGGLPQYGGEGAGPSTIYFQSWDNGVPTINYGDNGLKRFDKVVKLAEKKGIKLVVALTNNWADYGGMDVYTVNLGGQYHDDFYTNPKIKAAFKKYIKAVVTRYALSPAIFSWQLGNEPRCGADGTRNLPRSANCTAAVVTAWIDEMSKYIKTLDPLHLVSSGVEGFYNRPGEADWAYNGADGVDFDAITKLPHIDYGTFHCYPDWWSKTVDWTTQFIKDHAASQKKIGKPVVMEEYGWLLEEDREAWLGVTSNVTRVEALTKWQNAALEGRLAGDQYWQFGLSGLSFGKSTDDGFTIFLEDAEAKTLVYDHVKKVNKQNQGWFWPF
ncbi:glycoside hydrolase family 5 protein [Tulasnella calospora MUT 4182]|uniref:mannan endo-1,4-beta-mannosidase n=1 Tax=Tulasnella calospora MUT 4182 TaxID=1051891 RepID=A0A0C3Q8V5_9AGAM|nr:glycoside hydrolase family 5 protein [Tulasnella calospora MUT 4182]